MGHLPLGVAVRVGSESTQKRQMVNKDNKARRFCDVTKTFTAKLVTKGLRTNVL